MSDPQASDAVRARYERIAPFYDLLELLPEARYRPWRQRFWARASELLRPGGRLLEVGVGTGKNMAFWPSGVKVVAVDLSPRMLVRARRRASRLRRDALIELGDVEKLDYSANSFDLAAMTFVMCSVPDPVLGLREIARVVRPDGRVLMMEHVRSKVSWIGKAMDLLNPIVRSVMGPNINRETVENVVAAGLELIDVENIGLGGIFKMIEARVPNFEGGDNL